MVRILPNLQVPDTPRMWRPFHTSPTWAMAVGTFLENLIHKQIHPFLGNVIINMSARHAEDQGSIPSRGIMPLPSTWPRHARRVNRKR